MMMGTTIVAVMYVDGDNGGVVLAADSRCSVKDKGGSTHVLTEEYVKILKLSETTYACVSGNAIRVERVYHCVRNILCMLGRTYGRPVLVRELAVVVSYVIAQDETDDVSFIVGGWDADSGPQIYYVKGGVSDNLKYKCAGSGARHLLASKLETLLYPSCSKEIAKTNVLELLKVAVKHDSSTGGQLYMVTIDKTGAVNEVFSGSGEVIPKWAWM